MQQAESTKPFRQQSSGRHYKDSRYRGFFQKMVARREQVLARRLLDVPYSRCNGHIVDIPCGYGRFYPLLRQLDMKVSAMDQSQAMVELYQEMDGFRPDHDHAQQADVLKPLPADADRASRALCVRLFQHLHHGELRVQALRTLGANRRRIVMTYYDDGCLHYWSKRLAMWLKGKKVRVKMIPRARFESEVAAAGLRIVKRIKLVPGLHAQTWVLLEPLDDA
ncbi:class I SAM-dependent methyltransferase [Salinisphaera aquimarina]|uniref:Class I SAM-dependent methyltransferase n=1 Tax=Salinisphaera aquimarina TaxID=2094031 RepID=A0ABV7EM25_9GAMM